MQINNTNLVSTTQFPAIPAQIPAPQPFANLDNPISGAARNLPPNHRPSFILTRVAPPNSVAFGSGLNGRTAHGVCLLLGEEGFDDVAVDVGEAVVAALEAVGESGVVEAEEVEDGGLEVVDVDFVLSDAEAELVGLAVAVAAA